MQKVANLLSTIFIICVANCLVAQGHSLDLRVTIGDEVRDQFSEDGRLYVFMSENPQMEPRTQTWPNPFSPTHIFAKNMQGVEINETFDLGEVDGWISTADWSLGEVPEGQYVVQVLWDQDTEESRTDAPGNIYSVKQFVKLDKAASLDLNLNQIVGPRSVLNSELARSVNFRSELLSQFWGKDVYLKASILLPANYDDSKSYPIRYNVAGYGGRYTRINNLLRNEDFVKWWNSEDAPQVITVFLDGEGPFGDSYQMDSDNSGPYGQSLIEELIPHIESKYRGTQSAETRFVDGCSTGGWVSLGLQLYYPDIFNGVFSYSPDAIEFENYQLINIYKDKNAFVNEFGYPRPVMRDVMGEPMLALEDFIQYENVLGSSNTYVNSGGQFSAHTALYSPKGENGLPAPLVHPTTGEIDASIAEHWKKYDFKIYTEKNWKELGPKLENKIYIWMGDMDHFYLNPATRAFSEFLKTLKDPVSDAVIEFSPMAGHCQDFSHKTILSKIDEKLKKMKK